MVSQFMALLAQKLWINNSHFCHGQLNSTNYTLDYALHSSVIIIIITHCFTTKPPSHPEYGAFVL